MAFLRPSVSHRSWLAPGYGSYDPNAGSYFAAPPGRRISSRVGAITVKGAAELGKQGIVLSDQVIRDLDIPIMQEALDLMDKAFAVADDIGVGPEVRAAVYAIRGAEYASVAAGAILPPAASAAGASVLASIGGVAALGAVAVVAAVVFSLFGGDDDEAEHKRVKAAQASVLHLRDRLTLDGFAQEQDGAAAQERILAQLAAAIPAGFGSAASHQTAATRADKLALFYRTLKSELSYSERALYESLANLARWTSTLQAYQALKQSERDAVDVMFGKSEPRLPSQLAGPIATEQAKLAKLVGAAKADSSGTKLGTVAVLAGAGALVYFYPAAALGAIGMLWRGTKRAGSYVASKVKGVGT